jgi:hypothetical protein
VRNIPEYFKVGEAAPLFCDAENPRPDEVDIILLP